MSSFDAGSVTGALHFDLSEYTKSMIDAESLMQAFPAIVLEFMENPMLAVIEVFKEAADAFGETIAEVGNQAQQIGLAAEKAGVSVQWFSEMSNVAKTVGISTEQLSTGFKFLQRTATDAAEGINAQAGKAFNELGLSADFLKAHLNDTQGLFAAVQERIQALPSAAQRTQAAMEVLGRSGSDLVPLFNMSKESMSGLIAEAHKLGAVEDDASAATGQKWATISATISEAWEGIKRKLAEPILDYLGEHMDEMIHMAEGFAEVMGGVIPIAMDVLKVAISVLTPVLDGLIVGLEAVMETAKLTAEAAALIHIPGAQAVADEIDQMQNGLGKAAVAFNNLAFGADAASTAAKGILAGSPGGQAGIETPSSNATGSGAETPRPSIDSRPSNGGGGGAIDLSSQFAAADFEPILRAARQALLAYPAGTEIPLTGPLAPKYEDFATGLSASVYNGGAGGRGHVDGGSGGGGGDTGGGGGYGGIVQVRVMEANPSLWSELAGSMRPVFFELGNMIASAYANVAAPASGGSSSAPPSATPGTSGRAAAVTVQIQSLKVEGVNPNDIGQSIAKQIAPQIQAAFTRQQQAAEAGARHSKVEAAVNGQGD